MKKILMRSVTGLMVFASSFFASPTLETKVLASSWIEQKEAEEKIANAIVTTGIGLIGKATYAINPADVSATYPYKFRCGSFVHFVFRQNGVDLATTDEDNMMQLGEYIPRDQLKKGDLVFFDANPNDSSPADHVGIYYVDNKILHMANAKSNIVVTDMTKYPYYSEKYVTARRIIPSYILPNPVTQADKIVQDAYASIGKVKISSTNNDTALTFTNPGWVEYLYRKNGAQLGSKTASELMTKGQVVAKKDLKKGDLVFFNNTVGSTKPTLVGIYAGNQKLITSSAALGVVSRTFFYSYYNDHYITARRVLAAFQPITTTYTVKSGDTLYLISKAKGITVSELKRVNNITTDTVYVGQVLKIPSK